MSEQPDLPRVFFAPGKLMLAGEYSVLGPGGLALAVALAQGVEVVAEPAARWELGRQETGCRWQEGEPVPDALRFLEAGWRAACVALGEARPRPHRLLSRHVGEVGGGAAKPGIGGSASACVAAAAAVFGLSGRSLTTARRELLEVSLAAHAAAQGGRGSGYDVATAVHGGLLGWRPGSGVGGPGVASPLTWPAGLAALAGSSGRSASTVELLGRVAARLDPLDVEADYAALGVPVQALADALGRGEVAAVLAAVRCCQALLVDWDRRRGLGLVTPELAELVALAEAAGAAAKISGAGGGDSVLALAARAEVLATVAERWRAAGFASFPVEPWEGGAEERAPGGGGSSLRARPRVRAPRGRGGRGRRDSPTWGRRRQS